MSDQTDSRPPGSRDAGLGPAVVYFAKAPLPGQVKTRLVPPLTEVEAAALYSAFVRQVVVPIDGARTLVYGWPDDHFDHLRPLIPEVVELRPQRGDGLFERMARCADELFAEGYSPVLIRNTDSPDLPPQRVPDALARSRPGTVVLGPDEGGGYYLVALAQPCPELFAGGVREGADDAFTATVLRAQNLGLRIELLPRERDVDTFDDLLALWRARAGL